MTDLDNGHPLGDDILKDAETKSVQYSETIIPGDALKVIGATSDNQEIVEKISDATDEVRFIAMFAGVEDQFQEVMCRGQTKVTFGDNVTPGTNLEFTADGKAIDNAGANPVKGYIISDGTADGDLGDIYFDGGMN